MEVDKNVTNPLLVGAMQLLRAEDNSEHKSMFMAEMSRATLLCPALIDPEPEKTPDGGYRLLPDSKLKFPMLTAMDGKNFFVAYTDVMSLKKNGEGGNVGTPEEFRKHFVTMSFADYGRMLLTRTPEGGESPCYGIVVNPFGENLVVTMPMVAAIMQRIGTAVRKAGMDPDEVL